MIGVPRLSVRSFRFGRHEADVGAHDIGRSGIDCNLDGVLQFDQIRAVVDARLLDVLALFWILDGTDHLFEVFREQLALIFEVFVVGDEQRVFARLSQPLFHALNGIGCLDTAEWAVDRRPGLGQLDLGNF